MGSIIMRNTLTSRKHAGTLKVRIIMGIPNVSVSLCTMDTTARSVLLDWCLGCVPSMCLPLSMCEQFIPSHTQVTSCVITSGNQLQRPTAIRFTEQVYCVHKWGRITDFLHSQVVS